MKRNKEVDPSAEWPEPIDLLRSFAPVHPKETYTYRPTLNPSLLFDISKAWRLIDGWTPAERVARFAWRTLSDHDLDTHQIDTDQAKHADLGIPMVWATVEEPNPRTGLPYTWTRMIDGYHRVYKGLSDEAEATPSVFRPHHWRIDGLPDCGIRSIPEVSRNNSRQVEALLMRAGVFGASGRPI